MQNTNRVLNKKNTDHLFCWSLAPPGSLLNRSRSAFLDKTISDPESSLPLFLIIPLISLSSTPSNSYIRPRILAWLAESVAPVTGSPEIGNPHKQLTSSNVTVIYLFMSVRNYKTNLFELVNTCHLSERKMECVRLRTPPLDKCMNEGRIEGDIRHCRKLI